MDEVDCVAYSKQHHYAKGSAQREQLTSALESFQKKAPLQVPIVVGGKEVSLTSTETYHFTNISIDQNCNSIIPIQPFRSLLHCRLILQCHPFRCLISNRSCLGSQTSMGIPSFLRPRCYLPQSCGSRSWKIPLPNYGSHNARSGQECMAS